MATKHQDTLHDRQWTDVSGRKAIETFAEMQWRLGERLSYHGMTVYPPDYGGQGGAEVDQVMAQFLDGSVQQVEEAKFNYSCLDSSLTHVVVISADVAKRHDSSR